FPALAKKYFGDASGLEYEVEIVDAASPSTVMYRSTEKALGPSDVEVRLFHIGFAHLNDPFVQGDAVPPQTAAFRPEGPGASGASRPEGLSASTSSGVWLLRATHRDGSIEIHVARERRRDLLFSVGIIGLLVASVALLFASARRARRLDAQRTAFIAGVSHELRTPLAVIRSAAENLADGLVVEPGR